MSTVKGYVEHIVYRNENNGYTVMEVVSGGKKITLVGSLPDISEGEPLEAEGSFTNHPLYGEQLVVTSFTVTVPEDTVSIERYLGSGAIKGIGPAIAARIVKKFKADTLRIIDEEPERLAEVKGISENGARQIAEQVLQKRELREAMIFLQKYGISLNLSVKIYNQYGPEIYTLLLTNPYKIADDIPGVGFKTADEIAARAGISADSVYRIKSGIYYTMMRALSAGHVYLPLPMLKNSAMDLLRVEEDDLEQPLMELLMEKRIMIRTLADDTEAAYAAMFYYMEINTARMLLELDMYEPADQDAIDEAVADIEDRSGVTMDPLQREAVRAAVENGVSLITGGPGTGKTTTIRTIIRYFERQGAVLLLAAPTGRAAKRMSEAAERPAVTIHRLLEFNGKPDDTDDPAGENAYRFEKNENDPLRADVIVIDEMSMVDINLMHALLKAVTPGTRLVLVGDADQLPSVGPGNVLKDIIDSGKFHRTELTRIFRQDTAGDIVVNAHKILSGERIDSNARSRDFLFVKRYDANHIVAATKTLISEKLPGYLQTDISQIQVLTPMRKGVLGVENLNKVLQEHLNPPAGSKREKEFPHAVFREGDKVMQIRNNYQLEWEIRNRFGGVRESGTGVFNGDMGVISGINLFTEEFYVTFDDAREVIYKFSQADELELAYAVTVHKSQGSEYDGVIIPILSGPSLLMNRNLIYTAVTRAKACVCIVGPPESFQAMADNMTEQKRYSGLDLAIREIAPAIGRKNGQDLFS